MTFRCSRWTKMPSGQLTESISWGESQRRRMKRSQNSWRRSTSRIMIWTTFSLRTEVSAGWLVSVTNSVSISMRSRFVTESSLKSRKESMTSSSKRMKSLSKRGLDSRTSFFSKLRCTHPSTQNQRRDTSMEWTRINSTLWTAMLCT